MRRLEIKTGQRFGRLTIIEEVERYRCPNGEVKRQFKCKCDCGESVITILNDLRTSKTISCGCYGKEKRSESLTKHGLSHHSLIRTWANMIQRCQNPTNKDYHHYGGRGITVCDRWRHSFPNFLNDMGEKPSPEYSIDRRNNNEGYNPENCYWATKSQQIKNRRPNKIKT
jgi:hypothetical protein